MTSPEPENRGLVLERVAHDPGAHLRELARRVGVPLGTALYHLDRLEREGLVVAQRDGRYKRYFPARAFGSAQKGIISALRRTTPRAILLAILEVGALTQKELVARTGSSRSTVSFQLAQLVSHGIIESMGGFPSGRGHMERRYALADVSLAGQTLERFATSLGIDEHLAGPPGGA